MAIEQGSRHRLTGPHSHTVVPQGRDPSAMPGNQQPSKSDGHDDKEEQDEEMTSVQNLLESIKAALQIVVLLLRIIGGLSL